MVVCYTHKVTRKFIWRLARRRFQNPSIEGGLTMSRPPSAVDPSSGKSKKSLEGAIVKTEEAFGGDGDTPAPLGLGGSVTEMQNESSGKVTVSQEVGTGRAAGAAGAAGARVSYAGAVDGSSKSSSSQPIFEVKNGVAEIEIPVEIFEDAEPLWKCFMVGYFINDAPILDRFTRRLTGSGHRRGKHRRLTCSSLGRKQCCFALRMKRQETG